MNSQNVHYFRNTKTRTGGSKVTDYKVEAFQPAKTTGHTEAVSITLQCEDRKKRSFVFYGTEAIKELQADLHNSLAVLRMQQGKNPL